MASHPGHYFPEASTISSGCDCRCGSPYLPNILKATGGQKKPIHPPQKPVPFHTVVLCPPSLGMTLCRPAKPVMQTVDCDLALLDTDSTAFSTCRQHEAFKRLSTNVVHGDLGKSKLFQTESLAACVPVCCSCFSAFAYRVAGNRTHNSCVR